MRTLRTQKGRSRKEDGTSVTVAPNAIFSVFEDFTPKKVSSDGYTLFPVYSGEDDQLGEQLGPEGIQEIKSFGEELSNFRYQCVKNNVPFKLYLLVQKEGEEYQEIYFEFHKKENQLVADLVVEQNDKKKVIVDGQEVEKRVLRKIKEMLVDSDTNENLVRFVAKAEWEATTYAILDANVNLGIFKNVYITLNTPFNCNMKWYVPNRKLVYGYKFGN